MGRVTTVREQHDLLKASYTEQIKLHFHPTFLAGYMHCVWHKFQASQCFTSAETSLTLFLSAVLHLLLYTGPGVMLSVPKDQLRAEDGGDAGCCGDLQHHHPPDTRLPAGWI